MTLDKCDTHWRGTFEAMAGPCEVLVETSSRQVAQRALDTVAVEAMRIERKFSRYRDDNIVHAINTSNGRPVEVDDETAGMLDFATRLHRLSAGSFDVTSGVLRRAWRFDGGDHVPSRAQVDALLSLVGWSNVDWTPPFVTLPPGMEIDLGGIGKEYAVDRCVTILAGSCDAGALVNFGGDLHVTGPRRDGNGWKVGVESTDGGAERVIDIRRGALATSGDARRFLLRDGVRYSHVLDPQTGWPVDKAPRSVTVLADTCTEAGTLSTLALLQGARAEQFLDAQGVRYWCERL